MFRSTPLFAVAALGVLAAGCQLPYEDDPSYVAERYPHRFAQQCNSWLTSHATGYAYCASPAIAALAQPAPGTAPGSAAPAPSPAPQPTTADAATDAGGEAGGTDLESLRSRGEQVYNDTCAACHQANGQGVPGVFPPVAGAGDFYGDPQNHAKIIVHGLSGEIVVAGTTYNGVMPPQGNLSDYDIAAVATYERTSWGNDEGKVLPDDVAAIR